jgi:hypothetical protein
MWFYITNYNFTIWCVLHNKYNGYNIIWFYITKYYVHNIIWFYITKYYVHNIIWFYITKYMFTIWCVFT